MGWILAAAAVAAASSIAVNEMNAGRGKQTPGSSVGGEKKGFEMPDLFKSKGGSLMGGNAPASLSQKLAEGSGGARSSALGLASPTDIPQPAPPQFGPAAGGGAFAELERQRQLKSLMGRM